MHQNRLEAIAEKLRTRDPEAISDLLEECGGLYRTVILEQLPDAPNLHETCLVETLSTIQRQIDAFDAQESSFANWSAGIARSIALSAWQRETRKQRLQTTMPRPLVAASLNVCCKTCLPP